MIDLILTVMGHNPVEVSSRANKIATKDTDFQYHDFHSTEFMFNNGAIARVTANFGCVHKHQHVLRVFGTKGTFILDDQGARLHAGFDDNPQEHKIDHASLPEGKGVLIPDFIDMVTDDNFSKPVAQAAQREFDLMRTVLAADKALGYNSAVQIEY